MSASSPLRGKFITLEGADGSGKTTQARLLAEALKKIGLDVVLTREPGGCDGAEQLRSLVLDPAIDWSPRAEMMLHFASRTQHVDHAILPALSRGDWVVCDRYIDSTMAYQAMALDLAAVGRDAMARAIDDVAYLAGFGFPRPELTIFLDVDPSVAAARLNGRGGKGDRYEQRGEAFHTRVCAAFLLLSEAEPGRSVVVDGRLGVDVVARQICDLVVERLIRGSAEAAHA